MRPLEDYIAGWGFDITTTLGETFAGEVVTYDKATNIVVFQDVGQTGSRRNLRFLKADCVKDTVLQAAGTLDLMDIISIDLNLLNDRENNAIRQAEADAKRIGVGVSKEGQEIFDALAKTFPVQWEQEVIVVMNEVRVSSPYRPENVAGGAPRTKERVKKVLELLQVKMQVKTG